MSNSRKLHYHLRRSLLEPVRTQEEMESVKTEAMFFTTETERDIEENCGFVENAKATVSR